ncbi:MAG: nitroreductase family protein [Alphaproteobacteria bacterium]|jgi:nitroreductase|nr:nitroreductase family protein [Alphaproteobacteria bacterium]MDP6813455.1 nitroreductase family protein [Alphaproteobacteria bacterium]
MAAIDETSREAADGPSETIALLNNRVSVRKYLDKPVDDDLIEQVLRAAFRAPTSSNIQSYSVIIVRDRAAKEQLSAVTGGQKHVLETPLFLAFCADLSRIDRVLANHGHDLDDNNLEVGLVASIDAALVGMSAYLAADSVGLKGVMIGAVRNDAVATARILGLPPRVYCVFGLCLGWPDEAPVQKPRLDTATMIHHERYGRLRDNRDPARILADYDRALADHYRDIGKPTTEDSWSHDIDKKFHPQQREDLRRQLRELGFDFR